MCIDGMGMVDLAMNMLIPTPSQWPEFYDWAEAAFDMTDDSWVPAGGVLRIFGIPVIDERWSGSKPYGKMINAIYLLAYALRDEYIPQWHARADYLEAARAADNIYHGPFFLRFFDGRGEATTTPRVAARDRTDYHCRVFDFGSPSDDPANRASVIAHEGWHHWQHKYGWVSTHLTGGSITPPLEGDFYYRHGSGLFDFGTLWAYDVGSNPMKFHSPYQIAVEFDADLAEFSFGFIPLAVSQSARAFGNTRLGNQFFNATTYRIGQPRPF
jgi:hypothetical protein